MIWKTLQNGSFDYHKFKSMVPAGACIFHGRTNCSDSTCPGLIKACRETALEAQQRAANSNTNSTATTSYSNALRNNPHAPLANQPSTSNPQTVSIPVANQILANVSIDVVTNENNKVSSALSELDNLNNAANYFCLCVKTTLPTHTCPRSLAYLLDSGAFPHMSNDRESFHTLYP